MKNVFNVVLSENGYVVLDAEKNAANGKCWVAKDATELGELMKKIAEERDAAIVARKISNSINPKLEDEDMFFTTQAVNRAALHRKTITLQQIKEMKDRMDMHAADAFKYGMDAHKDFLVPGGLVSNDPEEVKKKKFRKLRTLGKSWGF